MKQDELYFYQQITHFFSMYAEFEKEAYNSDGTLTKEAIQETARLLIENRIYWGDNHMKIDALNNFLIILPDWVFDKVKE